MRFTAGMVKSDGILIMPVSVLLIQRVKLSRRLRPMRPHHVPVAEIRNFRFTQGVLLTSSDEIVDIRVPRQVRCFSCACDQSAHDQKREAQRERNARRCSAERWNMREVPAAQGRVGRGYAAPMSVCDCVAFAGPRSKSSVQFTASNAHQRLPRRPGNRHRNALQPRGSARHHQRG